MVPEKHCNPVFHITYYFIYSKSKDISSETDLLLSCVKEHRRVFDNIPKIGFRKEKYLKNILKDLKHLCLKPLVPATSHGVRFLNMFSKHDSFE